MATEEKGVQKLHPKGRTSNRRRNTSVVPSHTHIEWTDNHQQILEKLIDCLVQPPVLAFPDFSKPFVLHTQMLLTRDLELYYINNKTGAPCNCIWITGVVKI